MKFSLIVCTYQRPFALINLMESVMDQLLAPDEIIIIDGSPNDNSNSALKEKNYPGLKYFKIGEEDRGLTKQRNFGIQKVAATSEIVCFLDDDIILTPGYFQKLISTYSEFPDVLGVGGYIINEVEWKKSDQAPKYEEFFLDGYIRELGSRNLLRKKLGLLSDKPPGIMPEFSNGLSIGFLPPSGKTYPVEFFMGGVASFRKKIFEQLSFSEYFEGYGLYEDMDFCLRASRLGQLYVNTGAQLNHHHEAGGRPNRFDYGKMVIRNGWYVWRVKYRLPRFKARVKWHATAFLLTLVRLGNALTSKQRKQVFLESLGRIIGWFTLFFNKPKHEL